MTYPELYAITAVRVCLVGGWEGNGKVRIEEIFLVLSRCLVGRVKSRGIENSFVWLRRKVRGWRK